MTGLEWPGEALRYIPHMCGLAADGSVLPLEILSVVMTRKKD